MSHDDIVAVTQASMFFFEIIILPAIIWRKSIIKWAKSLVKSKQKGKE